MSPSNLDELLQQWEHNYKKGLLTFWMLLALAERPMYAYEMQDKIEEFSQGSICADENSIYRALRRFATARLVSSERRPSDLGPDRKYFDLTPKGQELLALFIRRNILVFQTGAVRAAISTFLETFEQDQ
jgi:PadR family transcriptional regulator PadR